MVESAADINDTIRLLLPGFVLMKVFYLWGLRTKRSDAQWALWSVLVAALLNALAAWMVPTPPESRIWYAFVLAIVGGVLLALIWRGAVILWPGLLANQAIRAWDTVLAGPHWVQVMTKDGHVFSGWVAHAASSVETDDLDLYIREPKLVKGGTYIELPRTEGILLSRERISSIAVFSP